MIASCVLRAPDGRVVADGETTAGVLEGTLYRNWRGAGVVRAGQLPTAPGEPRARAGRVRSRPENQVLARIGREDGGAHAVLRLSGPHPYLLPASADHVTGRLFAEATRQLVLGACAPDGNGVRTLHLSFPRLCTLDAPVRVRAVPCPRSPASARWRVLFSQAGATVCTGRVETGV
ncbi:MULTISPECIES: AfsA-related hotdog domain-containing protein [Kitasatospora]|uniref:A-factor biosynthesis hotdog domain-containing protein n=1 Tax=Kitasatospora setae (strain ATCC 33774 / DSM 43861 / JCM 3304 / KCC A-0304 / NBRC 14216 / KM-6054) TaxID=452652 RepID=E4N662_KITSK|nr:AfsA-related hotdog domain-containing protein [Kitasatospora setae]BAJ26693.1 hypothetical protein KSE_08560 [Kitasatospora setae KM-6054]